MGLFRLFEEQLGWGAFRQQDVEARNVAVPFDEGWAWSRSADEGTEQSPDIFRDRRVVAVDQQWAGRVGIGGVAGEMDLANHFGGDFFKIGIRSETEIMGAHKDVVDVDEQPAAAPIGQLPQEVGLAQLMARQVDIVGRILHHDRAAKRVLDACDIVDGDAERLASSRERQEVGMVGAVPFLPGKMVRHRPRLDPIDQLAKPSEVVGARRLDRGEGQADAMHRDRKALGQRAKRSEPGAAIDHIILGVNLEPQASRLCGQRSIKMFGLEAEACGRSHGEMLQAFGVSEPRPFGVWILVQVPAGTSFQALP